MKIVNVYAEMILARGDDEIRMLTELSQRILDGKGIPEDWATSVAIVAVLQMDIS